MATLKQRLHRKTPDGTYDTIHLETSADLVLMTDGSTKLSDKISAMDTTIAGKAASSHGTHVTFSTTTPKAAGTAAVGSATTVSRSDHVHPAQTSVTGNAGTATKLAMARTIQTNLGSTSADSFDGSGDVTPGVTGTLPVANGGTGVASIAALKTALGIGTGTSSDKLTNVPTTTGSTYKFAGYNWTIVHVTTDLIYAIITKVLNYITLMPPGYVGITDVYPKWSETYVVAVCKEFQDGLSAAESAALANVPTGDVIAKVFVATEAQLSGEFSYFSTNTRRVAYDLDGSASSYWCNNWDRSRCKIVKYDGSFEYSNGNYPSYANTSGFRPCIAFKR